jgi:hypothetical protein
MDGAKLEAAELAYLLVTVRAPGLVGVEDPRLFPESQTEKDATYAAGLKLLKEHGRLKPGPNGSLRMDDALLYLVAVAAEPEFVIFTIRERAGGERQLVLHYLAGPAIVELAATPDGAFHLGMIADRPALARRIAEMLAINPATQPANVEFTIGGPIIGAVKGLVAEGKGEQAAATLKSFGVNGSNGDAMIRALQAPDTNGQFVITHLINGQVEDGRRASIFGKEGRAWMMNRVDSESTAVRVQAVGPETLTAVVEDFIRYLAQAAKAG